MFLFYSYVNRSVFEVKDTMGMINVRARHIYRWKEIQRVMTICKKHKLNFKESVTLHNISTDAWEIHYKNLLTEDRAEYVAASNPVKIHGKIVVEYITNKASH